MSQVVHDIESSPVLIVQISDTHLCADPDRFLRGINTQECLSSILNLATKNLQLANLVLATGDISHDESRDSYRFIKQCFQDVNADVRVLPGNHDEINTLRDVMGQGCWPSVDDMGTWRLIGLNSHVPRESFGFLGSDQLNGLETALAASEEKHVIVALHHPPIETGSPWLDKIGLKNEKQLRRLLSKFNCVKAVAFGHAHQEMDEVRDGIRWLCCPSTCVQFLPCTVTAYSDTCLPGFRWLKLHAEGKLETGVERITNWPSGNGPDRRKWS